MNPIAILDLASVVLALAVFHLAHETQKNFGGLLKPAFMIFYSVCVLSITVAGLELLGFIVPDQSPATMILHLFMFAVLLLILLGLFSLSSMGLFAFKKQK